MIKARQKSWREKLHDSKDLPKVVSLKETGRAHWKGETMAIPAPAEVDDIMAAVPNGKVITLNEIRKRVARRHGADIGCPLTCGLFVWIAAHAAEEASLAGAQSITPYWRTLKAGGELNPKLPGGIDNQKARLQAEGHTIISRGNKWFVAEFAERLAFEQ